MDNTTQTIFLIADISGYTKFMRLHAINVNHAKQIVVRLIKALISEAKPPLNVAEIEGDAVFFYAAGDDPARIADEVKPQIPRLFAAFSAELETLIRVNMCDCDACKEAGQLKLKQVAHCGEAQIEQIGRFQQLFGVDVILVHRLLKNSVPANEYVLMTTAMHDALDDFYGVEPELRDEQVEGLGEVRTMVYYKDRLEETISSVVKDNPVKVITRKVPWYLSLRFQTVLGFIGLPRFKGIFRNVPS